MKKLLITAAIIAAPLLAPVAHADPPLPPGACQIGTGTCSFEQAGGNGGYVPVLGAPGWVMPGPAPAPQAPFIPPAAPAPPPQVVQPPQITAPGNSLCAAAKATGAIPPPGSACS
jgi:hypothetical protein